MKKIRMYRIGFGDCCCLRDRGRNLLVDFGTRNQKIGARSRTEVFERIWHDLESIPRKDLLLTGFLPAHTQGIVTLWNQGIVADSFGTVYLPDLFTEKSSAETLAMLLLSDLAEESYLPGKQVSLLFCLRTLVMQDVRIVPLSRGMEFAGKYRALWPDAGFLSARIREALAPLNQEELTVWRVLCAQAELLRTAVLSHIRAARQAEAGPEEIKAKDGEMPGMELTGQVEDGEAGDSGQVCKKTLIGIQDTLSRLRQAGVLDRLTTAFARGKTAPEAFRDMACLAFENRTDGELNLLFTGDVPPGILERIMKNEDGDVPVYDHYWCIKVPHHGTGSHYYDFRDLTPDNVIISNGLYFPDDAKLEKASRVSAQYAGLFYIPDATMYCSEEDCCDGNCNGCSCLDFEIVAPGLYKDI